MEKKIKKIVGRISDVDFDNLTLRKNKDLYVVSVYQLSKNKVDGYIELSYIVNRWMRTLIIFFCQKKSRDLFLNFIILYFT